MLEVLPGVASRGRGHSASCCTNHIYGIEAKSDGVAEKARVENKVVGVIRSVALFKHLGGRQGSEEYHIESIEIAEFSYLWSGKQWWRDSYDGEKDKDRQQPAVKISQRSLAK